MKAIEDGVKRLLQLDEDSQLFRPAASEYRRILRQVVQEALKEVIDADNRKP